MAKPSCRMHIVFARDVSSAVIIRRGPSQWYHLIGWETKKDVFTHGAWMRGRIYEQKCDISPDGVLFVYSVRATPRDPGYTHCWTAVSRAPWLHALVLWPQGTTYGGGGRWVGNRQLDFGGSTFPPHPKHPLRGIQLVARTFNGDWGKPPIEIPKADFSGHDQRGNLIYTIGGKLIRRTKREGDIELADFSKLMPDPQAAPDWAKKKL